MITDLSTKSVFKCYRSDEHFREFYLQDDGKIQLEQNDVTVTLFAGCYASRAVCGNSGVMKRSRLQRPSVCLSRRSTAAAAAGGFAAERGQHISINSCSAAAVASTRVQGWGGASLVSRLSACLTEANWWRLNK